MRWVDIPRNPDERTLRQFAGLWIIFFGGLALVQAVGGHALSAGILGVLAVTLGPLGLIKPLALKPIFVAWMMLAFPIGWTVSLVMLALLFFGIFTPLALWFRLVGRDALHRGFEPGRESYWMPKPAAASADRYFRQF